MIPAAVAVVVPAHNEQHRIADCLRSLRTAAAHAAPLPVTVVVVADACTDATRHIALAQGAYVVTTDARNVGAARAVGSARALHLCAGAAPAVWLATTDADSTVPPAWITHQLAWAHRGYDAVLGTIRLTASARRTAHAALHDADYFHTRPPRDAAAWAHPHIHGANLGLSAAAYERIGGFAPLRTGEDRDLVTRLAAAGHRIARSDRHPVQTAARLRGRAPGGLADLLASLAHEGRGLTGTTRYDAARQR
ncbi:glycosyltransferase [Streptomyces flavofungini]|uniref:glycosyltransferase n=1 Tax=Streptomyces flavofungini TaxID=68200 RepID=UPI0034E0188B